MKCHSIIRSIWAVAAILPVGHYPFDLPDTWSDISGNTCSMNLGGSWNGGSSAPNALAIAGNGSLAYSRNALDPASGSFTGWQPMPSALRSALAGSFSISLWLKTLDVTGSEGDFAFNGAGIVAADVPGLGNDVIPVALTGGQVAFNTGGDDDDQTLNSNTLVNDDEWHHIVVTRDQSTGQKKIYIDGALDITGPGTMNSLNEPNYLTIGALANAALPSANNGSYYNAYDGLLDDLQIYPRVIDSNEVAFLFQHPGQQLTNNSPQPVQMLNPQIVPGGLRFSFVTQSGHTHAIEARTNFVTGTWIELTNFAGDGALKEFTFPTLNPPLRLFRVRTQ